MPAKPAKKKPGRRPSAPVQKVGPQFVGKTPPALATQESAQNVMVASYGADRDLVNQLLAQHQTFTAISQFSRTAGISKLVFVKENKLYRALSGMKTPDGQGNLTGTWEEFCGLLGRSADQVDEDIKNLRLFGEEALASMSSMGIGYRDFRKFRALPEDGKTALLEVAKSGNKEALLDLAEELIAKQEADKTKLRGERDKAINDYESRQQVIQATKDENASLKEKLARIPKEKPDEKGKAMVIEVAATALGAAKEIKQLVKGVQMLFDHATEHGLDPADYKAAVEHHVSGLVGEFADLVSLLELAGVTAIAERLRAVVGVDG